LLLFCINNGEKKWQMKFLIRNITCSSYKIYELINYNLCIFIIEKMLKLRAHKHVLKLCILEMSFHRKKILIFKPAQLINPYMQILSISLYNCNYNTCSFRMLGRFHVIYLSPVFASFHLRISGLLAQRTCHWCLHFFSSSCYLCWQFYFA